MAGKESSKGNSPRGTSFPGARSSGQVLEAYSLKFILRGIKEPQVWTAAKEDCDRLGKVLSAQQDYHAADHFFCFDDTRGTVVCLNVELSQFAQVLWEKGGVSVPGYSAPEGARLRLDGVEEPLSLPDEMDLRFALEEAGAEDFLSWTDEDGEEVHVRVGDVLVLEYPDEWGSGVE